MPQLRRPLEHLQLDVLAEPRYRTFLLAYSISIVGTYVSPVALAFAVLEGGGNASAVGLVLMAQTLPLVVFAIGGGVLADRLPRKRVLVGADLLRSASQGLLAFLVLTDQASIGVFMALVALLGVGQALFLPAMSGFIPELASAERLQQANALRGLALSIGRTFGPAIGGVLVALTDAGWAIAFDALTYGVSAMLLMGLPSLGVVASERGSFFGELRAGWDEFRTRTWLWVMVVQFAFWHMLVLAPFMVLGAVVAYDSLGGASSWGIILAAFGAGAIAGGIAMAYVRPRHPLRVATVGTFGFVPPLVLLAAHAPTAVVAGSSFVAGVGMSTFGTLWNTTLQEQVPAEVRGRVSSYDLFGSVALLPIGYAIVGPIAAYVGVSTTLMLSAAWLLVTSSLVLGLPCVKDLRAPSREQPLAI